MSTEPIAQGSAKRSSGWRWRARTSARHARKATGTPQVELAALEHLVPRGGLTPGELGHRLGLTSGGVTALTGRLIGAGYVRRERHPSDGRMRVLGGDASWAPSFCARTLSPCSTVAEATLAGLPDADAELLAQVLERLASAEGRRRGGHAGTRARVRVGWVFASAADVGLRPARPRRCRTNEDQRVHGVGVELRAGVALELTQRRIYVERLAVGAALGHGPVRVAHRDDPACALGCARGRARGGSPFRPGARGGAGRSGRLPPVPGCGRPSRRPTRGAAG